MMLKLKISHIQVQQRLLLLLTLTFNSLLYAESVQQMKPSVVITDSKNQAVFTINTDDTLNRFNYFWSQKQMLNDNKIHQWRYQLLISNQSGETHWVYDPKGFAREITMDNTGKTYLLGTTRSFNRFLQQVLNNG